MSTLGTRIQLEGLLLIALSEETYIATAKPIVVSQTINVEGSPSSVPPPGLLNGATYGTIASITIEEQPVSALIDTVGLDGSFTVTHYNPAVLPDTLSFTFSIIDETGKSNTASITINMDEVIEQLLNLRVNKVKVTRLFLNRVEKFYLKANKLTVFRTKGKVTLPSYATLQNIVNNMAVGDWYELPNTVIPLTTQAEVNAITAQEGGDPMWGYTGSGSVIKTWNGSATNGEDKWWFWGGGHTDYGGNELYEFDLATLAWTRLNLPEALTEDILTGTSGKAPLNGSGAMHTYDVIQYNPVSKTIWIYKSTVVFTLDGFGDLLPLSFWELDPVTLEWTRHESGVNVGTGITCWDPIEQKAVVYPRAFGQSGPFFVDETGAITKVGVTGNIGTAVGVYNATNRTMLYKESDTDDLVEVDLTSNPIGSPYIAFTTPQEFKSIMTNDASAVYDTSNDEVVFYPGTGKAIFTYNPAGAGSMAYADNATSPVTPQNSSQRPLGKFIYHEPTDCFLLYNHEQYGVFVHKKAISTQLSARFDFTEIPEQVFVESCSEAENMNIFCLDTANLYPTGKLPWVDGDVFTPTIRVDVDGTLPTGVTWNRVTGKLSYDGSAIGANEIQSIRLHEPISNVYSDYFEVKVLAPTLVWNYTTSGIPFQTAVIAAIAGNTRTENVILVEDGEWQGEALITGGNGYITCMENKDNIYLIGKPGSMPIMSGTRTDWSEDYPDPDDGLWGSLLVLRFSFATTVHIKNIEARYCKLSTASCYNITINKFSYHTYLGTGWHGVQMSDALTGDVTNHLTNFLTYHIGAWAQQHPIYDHTVPSRSIVPILPYEGHTIVNNLKSYETKFPGNPSGGHVYKSISTYVTIRNSWLSFCEDPDVPNFDRIGDMGTSLHANQRAILYNNDFYSYYDPSLGAGKNGDQYTLLFQPRALQDGLGSLQPSYFAWPAIKGNTIGVDEKKGHSCWENWNGPADAYSDAWQSTRNPEFHGTNVAPYNYSTTGTYGDETANAIPPVDAPFWDNLGDVGDPANEEAYWKFITHCRFNKIVTPNPYYRVIAITSRTSAPNTTDGSDNKDFLPVPPNWVERTWLHACNNTFEDFQVPYHTDFQEPRGVVYAYGVNSTADATRDNITLYGGDITITDGVSSGTHIAIPSTIKI